MVVQKVARMGVLLVGHLAATMADKTVEQQVETLAAETAEKRIVWRAPGTVERMALQLVGWSDR